jgi:A/G-specific adenine glycosylase
VENISSLIINWFRENARPLPWRKEKNAYHILLSEVIMQQTRMEQGIPYYYKIAEAFPTVEALAAADEELLLRYWQGLGYYSRARNLHATAKSIVRDYNGLIPNSFAELKKLKGVGAYTAAAIASVAFGEAVSLIDGNVMRVVARLFAIEEAVNGTEGKNKIQQCLDTIFDAKQPGIFNEAIMEFGALQCVPSNPECGRCPLVKHCQAHKTAKVNVLPAKSPPKEVKTRYLNYLFLLIGENATLMKQRRSNDIWKNLYEFPLIETAQPPTESALCTVAFWQSLPFLQDETTLSFKQTFFKQHKLTHRLLNITFTIASIASHSKLPPNDFQLMTLQEAETKPKPVVLAKFLNHVQLPFPHQILRRNV